MTHSITSKYNYDVIKYSKKVNCFLFILPRQLFGVFFNFNRSMLFLDVVSFLKFAKERGIFFARNNEKNS